MNKPVKINVMLGPDQWKELRQQSLDRGVSASSILREAVDRHLTHTASRKGPRVRAEAVSTSS